MVGEGEIKQEECLMVSIMPQQNDVSHIFHLNVSEEYCSSADRDCIPGIALPQVIKVSWIPSTFFISLEQYQQDFERYCRLFSVKGVLDTIRGHVTTMAPDDPWWLRWMVCSGLLKLLLLSLMISRHDGLKTNFVQEDFDLSLLKDNETTINQLIEDYEHKFREIPL